ncbi:MAG: PDDEXK nuclease domain-containing protein [Muribaculaceae bacterium]|nr:PDDEXK nuclease domain-containing protein [Muribaculaceae bacterium]
MEQDIDHKLENNLYEDVCHIIEEVRYRIAVHINSEASLMNWNVGNRIKEDILLNTRAPYGKKILKRLADKLTAHFGTGWGYQKLQHCVRAAYTFSKEEIMYAVRTQLSWSHLRSLMAVENDTARQFYMEMCRIEQWSTRTLDDKIDSQLFERTAISRKPDEVIRAELKKIKDKNEILPDMVFRSSYFLDMLGLPDIFTENDLESAILNQIQQFIKEFGSDFAFVDRQKRIPVDGIDYRLDLLFYHRGLRRLVAIDLKLGKFKPAYEGQMLLYLRYLNSHDRREGEASPIGLILCSEGNTEHIEYLMLDEDSPIKVAQYYTKLPDKKVLSEKLQRAIAIAKEHYKRDRLEGKDSQSY